MLDVVAVVGTSAALQEDEQSERVRAQGGRGCQQPWQATFALSISCNTVDAAVL